MNEKFFALPQEKQNRILNAALKEFAACGYKSASTIEIARDAGISKALLFHYFHNKMELYLFLYRHCVSYVAAELGGIGLESEHDFFGLLLRSQDCKCGIMARYRYLFDFLVRAFREEDPEICRSLRECGEPMVSGSLSAFLERIDRGKFREGVDADLLLKMLLWCGDGCMREKFRQPDVDPNEINREFSEILRMLRNLLYKEEAL